MVKNTTQRTMHIIVARDDEYTDALAATPLADVLNAPLLLNPKDKLDPRVETEIKRLAASAAGKGETVQVHLLGGTNALSHDVENAIDKAMPKVGIRPIIDGRRRGVRESLEEQTMGMAQADAACGANRSTARASAPSSREKCARAASSRSTSARLAPLTRLSPTAAWVLCSSRC